MPTTHQSPKCEAELVAFLRNRSASLPAPASEVASTLMRYACAIEAPPTTEQALKELDLFAHHYKGLRDVVVPGVEESEWFATVAKTRRLCRSALRARGLDKSLVGRLVGLFRPRGGG